MENLVTFMDWKTLTCDNTPQIDLQIQYILWNLSCPLVETDKL